MNKAGFTLLVMWFAVFPAMSFAGGAHVVVPFDMNGQVSDLKILDDRITFLFTGAMSGHHVAADGVSFELSLKITKLPVQVSRAFAYEGKSPMGFEFKNNSSDAHKCVESKQSLRLKVTSPVLYFDQTMPNKLEGNLAQLYGCY